ncbi:MAG TPA: family 78 glycoside hydrolase catalytic domain [Bacteroidales bacterium]|nr:family 78 glycoside hydrolase catalytic domain [Bacteroidales bacterium]
MRKRIQLLLLFPVICMIVQAQIDVTDLLTENRIHPVGIDVLQPRFTWRITAEKRNAMQSAYEVKVITNSKKTVWSSGKVMSDQSVFVPYAGSALESGKPYFWQVRVWDNNDKVSKWSPQARFVTGFFKPGDWKAKWIIPGYEEPALRPSPMMRKQFNVSKKVASAYAFITSHGLYEAFINGQRVGDEWLTPGWTSYKKRLQYQVYDVTSMVTNGNNAIGVMLANGWYRGIIGYMNNLNYYGKDIALLMQIDITYTDGTTESIISDGSWKSSTGEITYSEIYNGEINDARLSKPGWDKPGYNDAQWFPVKEANLDMNALIATWNEPVKQHETFVPVKIFRTPAGEQVIDFGQNLVGWVEMKATGSEGTKITLSHAEVLDKSGNFYTENLRQAKAQDVFYLKGAGEELFHPHFTWHGFRYLKIEGYPGEIKPENFKAVTLYSDMPATGEFTTSDPLINQLQHNIQWGQKGNFLDVPTDCPQRDERLGWTGDAQVFSRTAAFNMNVNSFFAKWLRDVEADQVEGKVPFVVPNVLGTGSVNSCGWADVATIVPWNMYLVYGDKKILEQQYNSMKTYVESIRKVAVNDLWNTGFHFGDWLFYRPDDDNDGRAAVTDKYLIAQCFYARSTQLLVNAAKILGKAEDEAFYTLLLNKIKAAFVKEYMTPNGRLVSGTQTAYVLALNFDMLPEVLRKQAADRLAENVKSYGNHLTTGFLGTPYLCHVLTRFGYSDIAYQLLLQRTYPSWLYPVTMGATTIWERWDGQKPDSTFQTPGMNSFNHYAYGAIGDWMYRSMAGLDTYEDAPGYKHSLIKPIIGGGFAKVSASLHTYYGTLSNSWKLDNGKLGMDVEIPVNTRCTVFVPGNDPAKITEGGKPLAQIKEIRVEGVEDGYVKLDLGSGIYRFVKE